MKAVAVIEPGKLAIVDISLPALGPYQALVKTEMAVLCNSTDSKLLEGHFPGVTSYPLILGHEGCGKVVETGNKVRSFKTGDRVVGGLVFDFADPRYNSGWGGFSEYTLVNDHDAMTEDGVADDKHGWLECYEIQRKTDYDIPVEEAALLCTWREVYGGFGDFGITEGQKIIVFGAGPVGLSFVKFGKLLGVKWIGLVDKIPWKLDKGLAMGADAVFLPEDPKLNEYDGRMDAVIDAVGNQSIINTAVKMVRMGGSVCVYGVLSDDQLIINKSTGPYNFNILLHQWPTRWREREAQEPLSEWIRQGKLKASEFVTHRFKIDDIQNAFAQIKQGNVIKVLIDF